MASTEKKLTAEEIKAKAIQFADSKERGGCTAHQCLWRGYEQGFSDGLSLSKEGVNNVEEHIKEIQRVYLKHYEKTIDFKATEMISEIVKYFRSLLSKEGKEEAEWIDVNDRLPNESIAVIVCTNQNKVGETWFNKDLHWHTLKDGALVTHWMHKPLPPTTKTEK